MISEIINGVEITEIRLENNLGMKVSLINLGAAIKNIEVPDAKGNVESVVVHPENIVDYIGNTAYYGKICGRTAGRIENGKLNIKGKVYDLDKNERNITSLHGGFNGISEKCWDFSVEENEKCYNVVFEVVSQHLSSGFPGDLKVKVTYHFMKNKNDLIIDYEASSNQDTVCNLTNHAYFNLSGNGKRNILNQKLFINASKYTNLDDRLITTSIDEVTSTMDFRVPKRVGKDIFHESLKQHRAFGYDHAFIFDDRGFDKENLSLYDNISKRELKVYTTYPCVVVYSCNYPKGDLVHKNHRIQLHDSVCLECQFIPNGINMFQEDESLLETNKKYFQQTKLSFNIKEM